MKSTPKTGSEFDNFREFVRKVVNVPGAEVKRKIEQERQERKKKKRAKTSPASRAANVRD